MNQLLNDIWNNLQGYYDNIVVLLPKLLVATLIFLLIYFIAGKLRNLTRTRLNARMDDPLLARFLSSVIRMSIIIIGVLVFLQIIGLGKTAGGLLAGAGVGAFVIGFAFKDIGENLLSGVMLAFNRPFRVGDVVEAGGAKGKIVSLNLRNTHIKTFDGKDVYIPNANVIKNNVINYTIDGYLRYSHEFGLDNGSDIGKAQRLILEKLKTIHGVLHEEGRTPSVFLTSIGTHTMNITVYYWLDTFDKSVSAQNVQTQVMDAVMQLLDDNGYYLPGNVTELKNFDQNALTINSKAVAN